MGRPGREVWDVPEDDRFDEEEDDAEDDAEDGEDAAGDEAEETLEERAEDDEPGERTGRLGRAQAWRDRGMATAEYAIATLAACGFAGLLLALLRSSEVRGLLSGIVRRALSVG